MKVLLILADGMRPDSLADIAQAQELMKKSACTLQASTVIPSITLPCHMSLFHSVDPSRHGTTTNVYAPQVRPIDGLCEVLNREDKQCAFFYGWQELRDLTRPGSLVYSYFCAGRYIGREAMNNKVTDAAIDYIRSSDVSFTFLYLGYTDWAGHRYGWMSPGYMEAMQNTWENIDRVIRALPEEYTVIVTADHGGHDRMHGTELAEDMLIPVFAMGPDFAPGSDLGKVNIKDIAPTIAGLLGVEPNEEWEGTSFLPAKN